MDNRNTIHLVVSDVKCHDALRQPAAKLEVLLCLWLIRVAPSLWRVRGTVLVQVCLADTVMCFGRAVSENCQLAMEPERANLRSVLKAHAPGIKCLVPNGQRKFAGLVQGSPHDKAVFTDEGFCFETNILDVQVFSHLGSNKSDLT